MVEKTKGIHWKRNKKWIHNINLLEWNYHLKLFLKGNLNNILDGWYIEIHPTNVANYVKMRPVSEIILLFISYPT